MSEEHRTEAEAIVDLAKVDPTPVQHEDDVISRVLPAGYEERFTDLEPYRPTPRTKRGHVVAHTSGGLTAYAKRHLDEGASTLWADLTDTRITVILNDHEAVAHDEPGWADHRVTCKLRRSPEWVTWAKLNEQGMTQEEFAELLEERIDDIVDPDGARLLEVAQTLRVNKDVRFKQAVTTHSGERELAYEETHDASAGRTDSITVPREFKLWLRPFYGAEQIHIRGLFRYRVKEGRLTLSFKLLGLQEITEEAVGRVVEEVAGELELEAIFGVAPEARR